MESRLSQLRMNLDLEPRRTLTPALSHLLGEGETTAAGEHIRICRQTIASDGQRDQDAWWCDDTGRLFPILGGEGQGEGEFIERRGLTQVVPRISCWHSCVIARKLAQPKESKSALCGPRAALAQNPLL
jgi:hypothetical protein